MPPSRSGADDLTTTASLLDRVKQGDPGARDELVQRFLRPLQKWARGRVPAAARDLTDTDDLVQVTFIRALDRVKEFRHERPGGFLAYLRRILQNQIRDQLRRVRRRPGRQSLPEALPDPGPSPMERALGRETLAAYEKALETLPEELRTAVMLRLEMGFTHTEVATALGYPTANAARMAVARALVRLSEVMDVR